MYSKHCMVNLMADVIGSDDRYTGDGLNNGDTWNNFIQDVFNRIDTIEDDDIRNVLNSTNKETFQNWIDDPEFWIDIDNEVVRRNQLIKTIMPVDQGGYC